MCAEIPFASLNWGLLPSSLFIDAYKKVIYPSSEYSVAQLEAVTQLLEVQHSTVGH